MNNNSSYDLSLHKMIARKDDGLWKRPSQWPAIDNLIGVGEQKIVGLVRVDDVPNLYNETILGLDVNFNVDWGDGTVSNNVTGGTLANHEYDYSNINLIDTGLGYKVAIFICTPVSGDVLVFREFLTYDNKKNKILDMEIQCEHLTNIEISKADTNPNYHLHKLYIKDCNISNFNYMFSNLGNLRHIRINVDSFTSGMGMLNNNANLEKIEFNEGVTVSNPSLLFQGCSAVKEFPIVDTTGATNFEGMFVNCRAMEKCQVLNTNNATDFEDMFVNCYSLKEQPILNTTNATNLWGLFDGCSSLREIKDLNFYSPDRPFIIFDECHNLEKFTNCTFYNYQVNVKYCNLSAIELNNIFTALPPGNQVMYIRGNPGTNTCNRTIATAKGWIVNDTVT